MSVIVVKKTEKGFDIVCDNQMSWGDQKYQRHNNNDQQLKVAGKIFQVNEMTIGCAGSVADIGYFRMFCKSHNPKTMTHDDILDWFMEFKNWYNKETAIGQKDISVSAIVIRMGKCFTVFDFMMTDEITTFTAIGSGMWTAIGAMEAGADAEEAVKISIKYDLYCGGEIFKLSV